MSDQLILPVDAATLSSGFCPADYQAMLNAFSAAQSVTFPSTFTGITASSTKPSDQTKAWLQLDSLGRPVRLYYFAQGAWLALHPTVPGLTMWWFAALPDFTTFDGGDANGIGPASGAMWQQAKDAGGTIIAAKFPIVAGTLPSGKVLSVGDTGGEETHSLDLTETPPHTHNCAAVSQGGGGGSGAELFQANEVANVSQSNVTLITNSSGGNGATPPVAAGHNCLPLYIAGFLLQRSARLFYSVS